MPCAMGSYTHRVAIFNHRLIALQDGQVLFRWRDSAHKNKKRKMALPLEEFLRRFFLHVLPGGLPQFLASREVVRIRHFGFLAHHRRAKLLPLCRQLILSFEPAPTAIEPAPTSIEFVSDSTRRAWRCPECSGDMVIIERLTASQMRLRAWRDATDPRRLAQIDHVAVLVDELHCPARIARLAEGSPQARGLHHRAAVAL